MIAFEQKVIYENSIWMLHSLNRDGRYILIKPSPRAGFIYAFNVQRKDFKLKKKLQKY